ncbi:uncharacterized protein TNCV_2976421 [Trichonephila clavipes]|nr:uncharacterized protein TNCV_2976421 [Trichonephila clavipes]
MPTSARIVERVTVGSTSACRTILRTSLLVVFLVAPDPGFRAWVPSRVHCSQQFLTTHSERSTWPATRCVDQPAAFIPMIRPLSNSLNCEKCLLARLPGMFHLPKSFYNQRVIVTFMNLRICAGLHSTIFRLQHHLGMYEHAYWHKTWIICISHYAVLICKVSRLYLASFLGRYFQCF